MGHSDEPKETIQLKLLISTESPTGVHLTWNGSDSNILEKLRSSITSSGLHLLQTLGLEG